MMGHHFETKTPHAFQCWGIAPRPKHRQQIVHPSAGAPLRDQDTGHRPRHRQHIVHLRVGVPLRDQDTGNKTYISVLGHFEINKSYIFVLGHHFETMTGNKTYILVLGHFETKTPSTNRTSLCWAPLRDQDTCNKSYILVLGHHFETKTPATNHTS